MITRRRKWFIAAAGLLLAGAALWWSAGSEGTVEADLFFLGYTNPTPEVIITNGLVQKTITVSYQALVLVSNCGPETLIITHVQQMMFPDEEDITRFTLSRWRLPGPDARRRTVLPGETFVLTSPLRVFDRRWELWLEIEPKSIGTMLYSNAERMSSRSLKDGLLALLPEPKRKTACLHWITNLPPAGAGAGAAPASGAR